MSPQRLRRGMTAAATVALLVGCWPRRGATAPSARAGAGRYLVVARSAGDYGALRAAAVRRGAKVLREIPQIKAMVVSAPDSVRGNLAGDPRALGVARDRLQGVSIEDPPLCKSMFGVSDQDLAAQFGGPAETDWYGHGSRIGGNIAAALDGKAVAYARSKGTIIVAAAGNERLRIGAGGKVVSHGPLTTPGTDPADFQDYFGLYEVPGGVPGVVDVSSTGRVVNRSSASCPPGTIGAPGDPPNFEATCKPITDRHQAAGQGRENQLAYYSNYGPRIDLAGPGGARKFNGQLRPGRHRGLPVCRRRPHQRLGGLQHHLQLGDPDPVLLPELGGRVPRRPVLLDHPGHLDGRAPRGGLPGPGGQRPPVAAQAPGGLTGLPCPTGYCHLGGPTITDGDAYGAGLVNVANP